MVSSNRLQQTQIHQDWYAVVQVLSVTTGVTIGLLLAVAMEWIG